MKQVDVYPTKDDDGWTVKAVGFDTQGEAEDVARVMSKVLGGELVIHRPDGSIRDKDSHGPDSPKTPG